MSKVLTYSRFFPAYHPRVGEQTDFVGKIWQGLLEMGIPMEELAPYMTRYADTFHPGSKPQAAQPAKYHTMRAGNRWKVGDKFSPRVWSVKAYRSPQLVIGPDIEIKKVWDVEKHHDFFMINGKGLYGEQVAELAKNDGLSEMDLRRWFGQYPRFEGQIICWADHIDYPSTTGKPETL